MPLIMVCAISLAPFCLGNGDKFILCSKLYYFYDRMTVMMKPAEGSGFQTMMRVFLTLTNFYLFQKSGKGKEYETISTHSGQS